METIAKLLFAGVVALGFVAYPVALYNSERAITIKVESKERITSGEDSYYLVFTDNGEYKVADSFLYFDWRASTRYGELKEDQFCSVNVIGWRWGFGSMYPNVIKVNGCTELGPDGK